MHALTTDDTPDRLNGAAIVSVSGVIWSTGSTFAAGVLLAAAVVTGAWWWGVVGAAIGTTCGVAAVAARIDLRESRLPDRLVIAAGVPVLLIVAAASLAGDAGVLGWVALGVLVVAAPLLVLHLISPSSLGFGDVKLGAALGAALGLVDPRLGLVALCLASGGTVAAAAMLRRRALPFGPGLVLGTTAAFVLAGLIGMETVTWR